MREDSSKESIPNVVEREFVEMYRELSSEKEWRTGGGICARKKLERSCIFVHSFHRLFLVSL